MKKLRIILKIHGILAIFFAMLTGMIYLMFGSIDIDALIHTLSFCYICFLGVVAIMYLVNKLIESEL